MLSKPELPSKYLPHLDRARGEGRVRDKEPEPPTLGEIERVLKFFTK